MLHVPLPLLEADFNIFANQIDPTLPYPIQADLVDYWLAVHESEKWTTYV